MSEISETIGFGCPCGQQLAAVIGRVPPRQIPPIAFYRARMVATPTGSELKLVARLENDHCPNCGSDLSWVTAEYLKENLQDGGRRDKR